MGDILDSGNLNVNSQSGEEGTYKKNDGNEFSKYYELGPLEQNPTLGKEKELLSSILKTSTRGKKISHFHIIVHGQG